MGNDQLAIIIPAYNEESTIAQIVDELKKKYSVNIDYTQKKDIYCT